MTASNTHKGKVKIATHIPGKRKWENFRPIVEFCLANGCRFDGTNEKMPFKTDRGGMSRCIMVGPITLHDVLNVFELPNTFKVVHENSHKIEDVDNLTLFYLISEEEDARQKAKGEAILAREQEMLVRIRANRKARAEAVAEGGE